jgi:hypothetical protein
MRMRLWVVDSLPGISKGNLGWSRNLAVLPDGTAYHRLEPDFCDYPAQVGEQRLQIGGCMQLKASVVIGSRFLIRCWLVAGVPCALGIIMNAGVAAQQAEKSNMELVGYNDLQNRSAYQPVVHNRGTNWLA